MIRKMTVFVLSVLILLNLTSCAPSEPLINVILENGDGNIEYHTVLKNGKTKKTDPFPADPCRKTSVDTLNLSHEIIDGKIYHTVPDSEITDTNKDPIQDEKLIEVISQVLQQIDHDIFTLDIYELNGDYYVFVELNVNMSDPCGLYQYDFSRGQLKELHVWQDVDVIGLQMVSGK